MSHHSPVIPTSSLVATAIRWILGLLLLWAALSKLANLQDFFSQLEAYKMPLPTSFLRWTVIVLPWVELLCGLMLITRYHLDAGLICAFLLFGVFVLSTGQAWARGLNISCGCFDLTLIGIKPESAAANLLKSPGFAFIRALFLTVGAAFVWRSTGKPARQ